MAQCEGTTRSGEQCKREAQPDSRFCYLHQPDAEEPEGSEEVQTELDDLVPLLIAGAATLAFVLLFKSLGRLIPRL